MFLAGPTSSDLRSHSSCSKQTRTCFNFIKYRNKSSGGYSLNENVHLQKLEDYNDDNDKLWATLEMMFLLDKYNLYRSLMGPMKKYKTKNVM